MSTLPISVIIPCAYDTNLGKCIASIDADVEIIVVLNGATETVRKIVEDEGVRSIEIAERNLPHACNAGAALASREFVFLMNSDCTFSSGTLTRLADYAESNELIRCRVDFAFDNPVSKVIACSRSFIYNVLKKPYQPGLLISKRLIGRLGYLFDNDIHWTEDADLARRLDHRGIQCYFADDISIVHEKLSLIQDLRSAWRYGVGRRIAEDRKLEGLTQRYNPLQKYNLCSFISTLKQAGLEVAFYQTFMWSLAFSLGYFTQSVYGVYGKVERTRG